MAFPCGRRGGGWASLSCLATSCVACFFLCVVVCRGEPKPQDQLPVKSYAYASFQPTDSLSTLRLLKDAGINGGALQLTRDGFRAHRSGSVLLYDAFTLWRSLEDESSGPSSDPAAATAASGRNGTGQDQRVRVVSFNSTFSMSFAYCDRALPGEGLAFLIVPSSAGPPPGSHDGFLGLTNATFEASPARNQFVAVEFDMVKQSYDPSDNHVGLDIGTVVSNKTANLADFNITIATDDMVSATNYTVWIEYDGVARHIWVYMDVRGKQKPASPVLDAPLDLSKHVPGHSYVGFSGSTGATVGLNSILDWTLTVETFPEKKNNGELIFWIFYAVFWLLMIIFTATQCTKCIRQLQEEEVRHERRQEWLRHTLSNLPGMPTEFQYAELEKATEKFNEEQSQRWTGGYAPGTVVYKGLLSTKDGWSEAMEVAVKSYNFGRLDEEFHYFGNEIKTNNLLRHQNIVPIIGWCYKYVPQGTWTSLYQVFKYEHLSNGSLEQHLFRRDAHEERPALSWGPRYGIVTDVALALHYMHHEHSSLVLHRDIKPSNVMLDASFRARLSEFGMARVVEPNRSSFSDGAVAGTRGYIAPEYSAGREATRRTDVFAFGTLVLEVVTGRHALLDDPACPLLSDWVWRLHGRSTLLGAVEQCLGIAEFDEYEARRLLLLGMACSSPNPSARPTMPQVLQILAKSAPPPEVPLLKPTFMWPPEEDTTNDTFDESFRILAPPNNSQDFFPLLSSGR